MDCYNLWLDDRIIIDSWNLKNYNFPLEEELQRNFWNSQKNNINKYVIYKKTNFNFKHVLKIC